MINRGPVDVKAPDAPSDILLAVREIASTQAGQIFLHWLMGYLGFKFSSLTMTVDGVLLNDAIIHNEAKRATWLEIRKLIPVKLRNKIEMDRETQNVTTKKKQNQQAEIDALGI